MTSNVNGPRAPATLASSHAVTSSTLMPGTSFMLLGTVSRYRADMAIDVTDATFQTEVIDRSKTAAVVVDLWAPWCGPCRTLGPILEKVTDATNGEVVLVKVNVDENPGVSQAFQVQSIPAVYALKNGEVVDGFVGAHPEHVDRGVRRQPAAVRVRAHRRVAAGRRHRGRLSGGAGARAGQRGRDRRPRRAARGPWRGRAGAVVPRSDPRDRSHPPGGRRGSRQHTAEP